MNDPTTERFFKKGRNCWRTPLIEKGAWILSGQDYYRSFREAVLKAEHCVTILAWDIRADIEMIRDDDYDDGHPRKLSDFIFSILDAKPDLQIYILLWDYSMVYVAEREWLANSPWKTRSQPRLHFEVDDELSMGASHHQKVVVIDETVAFCGGYDLSAWRWDTLEHKPVHPERVTPDGEDYQPYHDIHMVVSGEVAHDLADLCALRWKRATGEALPRLKDEQKPHDIPWPQSIDVDLINVTAGVALTFSKYKDYEPSTHIEQLHFDIIAQASDYIYIENQYLSSHRIVEALATRLKESDGPEIIVVLTKDTGGLLEEGTLGVLRNRLLEILVESDVHKRFRGLYPDVADNEGNQSQVYVHAKLLIADDAIIELGSANLSNRSMRVDSEVDLALVFDEPTNQIKTLLRKLLAMHFQATPEEIAVAWEKNKTLRATLDSLNDGRLHALKPLETGKNSFLMKKLADTQLLDPDEPISPAHWMREAFQRDSQVNTNDESSHESKDKHNKANWQRYTKIAAWLGLGFFIAYGINSLWGGVLDKDAIVSWLEGFRDSPLLLPILFGIFLIAGLIGVPINLLLIAGTLALGPWKTFACGFTGSLASAAAAFWLGHFFGKPLLERIAKEKLRSLSNNVGNRGIFSVAVIRVIPIAPFVVINLVAGFSSLKFRTFISGSVIGMLPGMLGVVLVTNQAQSVLSDPNWKTWLGLIAAVAIVSGAVFLIRKKL